MSDEITKLFDQSRESKNVLFLAKVLSDGKPHKAGRMAYQLGVCTRTVRRTLHYMRDELNLPIKANRQGFFLDSAALTQDPPRET